MSLTVSVEHWPVLRHWSQFVPNMSTDIRGHEALLHHHHHHPQWSELRSCVKVEVAVLGSPSLIVLIVSVDVKQHWRRRRRKRIASFRSDSVHPLNNLPLLQKGWFFILKTKSLILHLVLSNIFQAYLLDKYALKSLVLSKQKPFCCCWVFVLIYLVGRFC